MNEIELLRQRDAELVKELTEVRAKIRQLEVDACPIKIGDVVRYKRDGKEYRVIGIDHPEWRWVYANPRKADGSFGTARRHLLGGVEKVA